MLRSRKPRVLLLDDDPSMQRLVSTILKREGYKVEVFLTGHDAIAAIDTEPFNVMLLDLMMPNEGGITVVRHLEKKNPAKLKHVIVLTASPKSVIDTIKDSVAGVVQKPFETAELIGAVRRVGSRK
jgi:DNA-binding response OmpR family regulator